MPVHKEENGRELTLKYLNSSTLDKFNITGSAAALSHTSTVVRECCKGDDESQWRSPKFTTTTPKPGTRKS